MEIIFEKINVTLGGNSILKDVDVHAEHQKITGIIGPNGSGKSTLIKTLFGIVKYKSGGIWVNGKAAVEYPKSYIAQNIGYIGQETDCPFDFTVKEMVAMGLYPHAQKYKAESREQIVLRALQQTGITDLADRSFLSLSGGEKKNVMLTRAIAQSAETLVLDEPTNHLDIRHQLFILDFLREKQFTTLIVLHDLNYACMYCDKLFLLNQGSVVASGTPLEVLTGENVKNVFGVNGYAQSDEYGQCRFFLDNFNPSFSI